MSKSLGAQLAQIRTQSADPLDLNAQKTIYQLCYDGFESLCRLDSRFLGFAGTLFSEQSKSQDRTQMTSTQNKELDIVLEDFIRLIGSRLSLRPALKAVEWIIRRFRSANFSVLSR